MALRVAAFVDGFNLYHAILTTGRPELKWLDLRQLLVQFAPAPANELTDVFYFSAYATWLKGPYARHRAYVRALQETGTRPVMGKFKTKPDGCRKCSATWPRHEEKETDVNAAIHLLLGAVTDTYDLALLVTADSDLAPAVRMVRAHTTKQVRIVSPVGRPSSRELEQAVGSQQVRQMQVIHLERALLPRVICGPDGRVVATRPQQYDPRPATRYTPP